MNERNLRYFRKTLSAQLEDLIAREKQTVEGLQEAESRVSDSVDQATKEAGINFRLRIQSREVRLMGKIRAALERIEEGTFGIFRAYSTPQVVQTTGSTAIPHSPVNAEVSK